MTDWVIAELEARPIVEEVMQERLRQVEAEGWSHAHDDSHTEDQLSRAAVAYILAANSHKADPELVEMIGHNDSVWPWDSSWWKPTNKRRDLIKAAALIIAEIERLDRAEYKAD